MSLMQCSNDPKQEPVSTKRARTSMWPLKHCIAVARVAYVIRQGAGDWREGVVSIDWVKGHFTHAAECLIARPTAAPPLPLHPEVVELTEHLLSLGVPTSEILVQNQQMLQKLGDVCATSTSRIFLEHKVGTVSSFLVALLWILCEILKLLIHFLLRD